MISRFVRLISSLMLAGTLTLSTHAKPVQELSILNGGSTNPSLQAKPVLTPTAASEQLTTLPYQLLQLPPLNLARGCNLYDIQVSSQGDIVAEEFCNGLSRIVVVDKGSIKRLTEPEPFHDLWAGEGKASDPNWSPDGTQIVFKQLFRNEMGKLDAQIFIMNSDGAQRKQISNVEHYVWDPVWSPDGSRIAFETYHPTNRGYMWEIYIADVDGSKQYKIANGINPVWSPDGSRIAYAAAPGDTYYEQFDPYVETWVVDVETLQKKRLTDNRVNDQPIAWKDYERLVILRNQRHYIIPIADYTNRNR